MQMVLRLLNEDKGAAQIVGGEDEREISDEGQFAIRHLEQRCGAEQSLLVGSQIYHPLLRRPRQKLPYFRKDISRNLCDAGEGLRRSGLKPHQPSGKVRAGYVEG